ncbi:hypothetical protein ACFFX1_10725 [Dactylosporangium sucinum]|uniref:Integral membrane protein n=1 Tax=Dactylosporangium sucinum TaxID=1424081 RepID=A0A917TH79_9ACTN|nr:hypothetical protein [Dactylosporangium sucinum]GGM23080.1 hypothetical protein GCM10007977_025380 [Dactylosporangium sucinum]
MTTTDGQVGLQLTVLMAEYDKLKDEQKARIDRRDHLVYGTLTAIAATLVAGAKTPAALLLLPAVTLILGWTHLVNDQKVSAAARYLRDELAAKVAAITGRPVLGWETSHRNDGRRRQRKGIQLIVDVATFVFPAVVSLGAYVLLAHPPVLGLIGAGVLLIAAGVLLWQQLAYASVLSRGTTR